MSSKTQAASVVSFGAFQLDLRAGELRRQGVRIKLQEQPLLVLKILLERPGEIVTREELRSQIWSADTFVDFDNSLNTAINKLREALGDSADRPCFIETVPRRGYRFVAPVSSASTAALPRSPQRIVSVSAALLAVALIAGGTLYLLKSGRARISSVAVLPFTNASGDPTSEYLADGITEGVIDRLSGLPDVKVISRTSAFHYKQKEVQPQSVAKELGVQALVTGRVTQHGDDLSVGAELVDTREDKQLWGEQYSRKLADTASIQQEIAAAISGNLRLRLTSGEQARLAAPSTSNTDSYQLYLKGRYHANRATAAGYKKGIDYFRDAIAADPGNAPAYAGMADAYDGLGGGLIYLAPSDAFPKAKAAASRAMELDNTLSEAHAALAYADWFYGLNWPSAEAEFKQAIALNPNNAQARIRYSQSLITRSRVDEALAEDQKAQELDPLSPLVAGAMGYVYIGARRYDDAIAQFQKALDLDPNAAWLHSLRAWAYGAKGMYPEALAEYDKIADQDKSVVPENQLVADGLGWLYAISGRRTDALKIAEQVKGLSSHAYVDFCQLASIYSGLGDKEEAFRLLEKGYQQHSTSLLYLAIDPFWAGLRSDPRFRDLMRRVGLPQ